MPADIVRASFNAFEGVDAADKVPSEIRLLKAGRNEYAGVDGDSALVFDDQSASQVMSRYQKRGIKLKADYEHQSLQKPPIQAPASAKSWKPEVRNGELWATDIQWTRKAKQMIADGEYDYFSIAGLVDKQSLRFTEIINFALTNNPAANGIEPFIATSLNSQNEVSMSNSLLVVALGLRADAGEADTLAAVSQLKEFEREIVALSGKGDRASALGALRAMQLSHEKVVALTAEVAAARAEKRGLEFDALVKQGDADRKITPSMAKDWIPSLRSREDGCEILKSFLASAAAIVEKKSDAPAELVQDASAPSSEEYAVAKAFVGDDPEAIKKRIAEVRALNTERKG